MADKIDILVGALKTTFITGYETIGEPAPIDPAIEIVPSNARIEYYPWIAPTAGFAQWQGKRRLARLNTVKQKLENFVFDDAFEVLMDDIDDDQTGGFNKRSADLAKKAKMYPAKKGLQMLKAGGTTACLYDGSNLFASSHTLGTGSNDITFTTADAGTGSATHATSYYLLALYTGGTVKPILWQNRSGPDFQTDAGSPASKFARAIRFWCELRGNIAPAFWHDTVRLTITGLPTVSEIQTCLGNIEAQFRTFKLPQNQATDIAEYVHEQTDFKESNLMAVASSGIGHIVRQALTLSLVNTTDNPWKGYAKLVISGLIG